ncbi:MAG TPA: hypothetical protein PKN12_10325, partial [Bacteroidales bacterium]|nr:hypothetical protein [Bacteroidales bacterium]
QGRVPEQDSEQREQRTTTNNKTITNTGTNQLTDHQASPERGPLIATDPREKARPNRGKRKKPAEKPTEIKKTKTKKAPICSKNAWPVFEILHFLDE